MKLTDDKNFSFIDYSTEEGDIAYCERCKRVGIQSKMQELQQEEGKPLPADADNFCQCYNCGHVEAVYKRKIEGEWEYPFETTDNPFDSTAQFMSVDKRKPHNRLTDYKEEWEKQKEDKS